jgi:hypothetical protein
MRFLVGLVALFPLVAAAQGSGTWPPNPPTAGIPTSNSSSVYIVLPPAPPPPLIDSGWGPIAAQPGARSVAAPELDPAPLGGALTLLGGGLLVLRGRRSASSN